MRGWCEMELTTVFELAIKTEGAGTGLETSVPDRLELRYMPVHFLKQCIELASFFQSGGNLFSILFE